MMVWLAMRLFGNDHAALIGEAQNGVSEAGALDDAGFQTGGVATWSWSPSWKGR